MSEVAIDRGISEGLTRRLAEHAMSLRHDALPDNARAVARQCLLDWLGVTLAGADDDLVQMMRAEAEEQGGAKQATLIGSWGKTSALQAALVNGAAGHALDFDDVHEAMPGHPSVPVMPVLLALAEKEGASGADVVTAIVAGIETECRVGMAMTEAHYTKGWHATGTVGTFGAAAAAARLMGFDADQAANALGIAATQAAGMKSMFGTMCKPMHAGKAAFNGLYAALLTRRGFVARPDILECVQGFGDTQSDGGFDPALALEGLGEHFLTPEVLFKFHAACYGTHATIEAIGKIVQQHPLSSEQVEKVEIHVHDRYLKMCNIQNPTTGLEGKFSLRFTASMALTGESTSKLDNFSAAKVSAPTIVGMRDRISVIRDSSQDRDCAEVIVSLKDGLVLREAANVGIPESDMARQWRRLSDKFRDLTTPLIGADRAQKVIETVDGLDSQADAAAVVRACQD